MMEFVLKPIFNILTVPDLKIKKPAWITTPSPWTIFTFILLSYFLVTGKNLFYLQPCWCKRKFLIIISILQSKHFTNVHHCRWYYLWCNCGAAQCWQHHRWTWSPATCGLHALQSQRPVHHGGPGLQLHVQSRRGGDDHPRPDPQPKHSEAQQDDAAVCWLRGHGDQLWMLLGLHEDEAPRIHDVIDARRG